jgi:hypothetical protein
MLYPKAGVFLSGTTAPPPSPSGVASAGSGTACNTAAARRQRVRQSVRSEAFLRLQPHADLLREKLAAIHQDSELVIEKERRNAISAEHFSIS